MGSCSRLLFSVTCFSAPFSNDGFICCSSRLAAASPLSSTAKWQQFYEQVSSSSSSSRSLSSDSVRNPASPYDFLLPNHDFNNSSGNNNNNDGGNGGGGGWNSFWGSNWTWGWWANEENALFIFFFSRMLHERGSESAHELRVLLLFAFSVLCSFFHFRLAPALSKMKEEDGVWELRGGKRIKIIPDYSKDEFVVVTQGIGAVGPAKSLTLPNLWLQCKEIFLRLMLPEGFPHSVTSDYLDYTLWRGVQGVASQISGVLATQALLYAVGLGKGAIPTAAAVNWVLKDGIGYLSKILLSKYGRHFDVHPKGWRLFADLMENAAYGLEILTPAFPHQFLLIGAVAGAGRSAAALIQVISVGHWNARPSISTPAKSYFSFKRNILCGRVAFRTQPFLCFPYCWDHISLEHPAIGKKMVTCGEGDGGENVTAFLGGPRLESLAYLIQDAWEGIVYLWI